MQTSTTSIPPLGAVYHHGYRHGQNLFAQIQIIQFLRFNLHAGVVPLDRKVAGLVFAIIISHHRLVINPELNVLAYSPDAITKPFAVFGQEFRCLSGRFARLPQPSGLAISVVANLGLVASREAIHVVRWRVGAKIEPAVGRRSLVGDAEHALRLKIGTGSVRVDMSHTAYAHQDAILDRPRCLAANRPTLEILAVEQRDPFRFYFTAGRAEGQGRAH